HGIEITAVYHCPHLPEITGDCNCRKPKPGMILKAIEEYSIDPVNSVLIGDKKSDILAGENAGIGKNLYIQDLLGTDSIQNNIYLK
ncbi:MAG: HAD-IIIA family hydrolase, partial [Bacteroidia bacterium]|nr:HAD-IIIA family hydrolase [Bacteroidia bacterium]